MFPVPLLRFCIECEQKKIGDNDGLSFEVQDLRLSTMKGAANRSLPIRTHEKDTRIIEQPFGKADCTHRAPCAYLSHSVVAVWSMFVCFVANKYEVLGSINLE